MVTADFHWKPGTKIIYLTSVRSRLMQAVQSLRKDGAVPVFERMERYRDGTCEIRLNQMQLERIVERAHLLRLKGD